MKSILQTIDIFDKFDNEELRLRSTSGAFLSIFLSTFGMIFIVIKTFRFFSPNIYRDLALNPSLVNSQDFLNISINVQVNLPCYFLHLDAIDTLGFTQLNINSTARMLRIGKNGKFIGVANESIQDKCFPCYGLKPEGLCCNSCEEMILMHKFRGLQAKPDEWPQCDKKRPETKVSRHEKCLVKGKISVNKVNGNFHIAPGRNVKTGGMMHQHDLDFQFPNMDLSHYIHHVRFGPKIPTANLPLKNVRQEQNPNMPIYYKYNLLITPVIYIRNGKLINRGYEYTSMLSKYPSLQQAPGIFFQYQFSPYTITITSKSRSFAQYITSTFGFLSGSFALAMMLDLFIQKEEEFRKKKINDKQKQSETTKEELLS